MHPAGREPRPHPPPLPRSDAAAMVGLPCLAVFAVACAFTGSLWGSALLLATLVSLLVHLGGAMYLAGIQVNAGESAQELGQSVFAAAPPHFKPPRCRGRGATPPTRPRRRPDPHLTCIPPPPPRPPPPKSPS